MSSSICRFPDQPFRVLEPEPQTAPIVLNSPHSGNLYSASFLELSRLNARTIRSSEDCMVDRLIDSAVGHGMPLLAANFPRAFLDVNREPYELDQAMFEDELPNYINKRSVRVTSGLGTIARIVAEGQEIYRGKLRLADALHRIDTLYKPYHAQLRAMLARTHVMFDYAILLDCHSMPSGNVLLTNEERPEIVLGDRFGSSCSAALVHQVREILTSLGLQVACNKPYAGGFITEHYGRPESGLHALQIEINRGLYMNETTLEPNEGFEDLARTLSEFFLQMGRREMPELIGSVSLAAE